jgi:uncharacterized protein (DUF488 family)
MERNNLKMSIWTIGHSTLSLDAFIRRLNANDIEFLVDIRSIPRSRHNPQFNKETLPEGLAKHRIGYHHVKGLGGLRPVRRDSINTGFRSASFRGYADYMQTEEFSKALQELLDLAAKRRTAIMCAEVLPWRCHRYLVADALVVRGVHVSHIVGDEKNLIHSITPFALVQGIQIEYPPP